jgi:hypothetical protein
MTGSVLFRSTAYRLERTIANVKTRPDESYPHLFQGGRDTQ